MSRELGEVVAEGFEAIDHRLASIEEKLDAVLMALGVGVGAGARTAEAIPARLLALREARGDAQ